MTMQSNFGYRVFCHRFGYGSFGYGILRGLLLILLVSIPAAHAHDPAKHGFELTLFEPTFPAPKFELPTLDDGNSSLDDYKGQYVLLNFWATWCPPCLEEMPSMESAYHRFKDRGFTVVAISSDADGKVVIAPFIEKLGVTFPILMDQDKAVSSIYGAQNLPLTFLLDREGSVIAGSVGARDWASDEAMSVLDELILTP